MAKKRSSLVVFFWFGFGVGFFGLFVGFLFPLWKLSKQHSQATHCLLRFNKLLFTLNIIYPGRQTPKCKSHLKSRCIICGRSHLWCCPIPNCKAATPTIPLLALRWGLSSPLSSSYTKPSVLERNGSLPLIDSILLLLLECTSVPKGCHFSISMCYNFISIWQLLTGFQVGERKGIETCLWNRKIRCKVVGFGGRGLTDSQSPRFLLVNLTGKRLPL